MPSNQVATVATYDFGAPVAEAVALKFRVREKEGGKLSLQFENNSVLPLAVTVQVSSDDSTYADSAIADLSVLAKTRSDVQNLLVRAGKDLFVQILAVGGTRGNVQIRPDSLLEIMTI